MEDQFQSKPDIETTAVKSNSRAVQPSYRRKRGVWTSEEKLKIVSQAEASDVPIADFARSRGISPNNIYYWIRQAREGKFSREKPRKEEPKSEVLADMPDGEPRETEAGVIEIVLPNQARIRLYPPITDELLFKILAAAKAAS